MAGRYKGIFNSRAAAEIVERNGKLFAGDLQIWTIDHEGRLPGELQKALGVGDHARLHKCQECGKRFIAHHAARLCTPACTKAAKKKAEQRYSKKQWEIVARQKGEPEIYCAHCKARIVNFSRRSVAYCSPACRQAAYRSRQKQ